MNACIYRIIQTINIRKKNDVTINNYWDHEKWQLFFTDNQNLWRKSRFHELGIRRMPRFFFLILHTVVKDFGILPLDNTVELGMICDSRFWLFTFWLFQSFVFKKFINDFFFCVCVFFRDSSASASLSTEKCRKRAPYPAADKNGMYNLHICDRPPQTSRKVGISYFEIQGKIHGKVVLWRNWDFNGFELFILFLKLLAKYQLSFLLQNIWKLTFSGCSCTGNVYKMKTLKHVFLVLRILTCHASKNRNSTSGVVWTWNNYHFKAEDMLYLSLQ